MPDNTITVNGQQLRAVLVKEAKTHFNNGGDVHIRSYVQGLSCTISRAKVAEAFSCHVKEVDFMFGPATTYKEPFFYI